MRVLSSLRALREGSDARVEMIKRECDEIQDRLEELSDADNEEKEALEEKLRSYKTVFDSVIALKTIEADLSLFETHLKGDDERLRSTAEVFQKEFLECREQIETQLNKILWEGV